MDHNKYEENGGRRPSDTSIFWILGMVHLWPVLEAVHGLRAAYVWSMPAVRALNVRRVDELRRTVLAIFPNIWSPYMAMCDHILPYMAPYMMPYLVPCMVPNMIPYIIQYILPNMVVYCYHICC